MPSPYKPRLVCTSTYRYLQHGASDSGFIRKMVQKYSTCFFKVWISPWIIKLFQFWLQTDKLILQNFYDILRLRKHMSDEFVIVRTLEARLNIIRKRIRSKFTWNSTVLNATPFHWSTEKLKNRTKQICLRWKVKFNPLISKL